MTAWDERSDGALPSASWDEIRDRAQDVLDIVESWGPEVTRFFLDVAVLSSRPVTAAHRWLPGAWDAQQARRFWKTLVGRCHASLDSGI